MGYKAALERDGRARPIGPGRRPMTVSKLCDEYLTAAEKGLVLSKRKRPKSETNLATDRGRIERHIKPLLGTMPVADVQPADIRKFLTGVQTDKTKATVKTKPKGRRAGHRAGGMPRGRSGFLAGYLVTRPERACGTIIRYTIFLTLLSNALVQSVTKR